MRLFLLLNARGTGHVSMRRLALVFPGQGSQQVGMGKFLWENFAVARHVFEEVDEALKQRLSSLMFDGEAEELNQTENAQPALLAHSIATLRVAYEETALGASHPQCRAVFGHSLGEFTAMAAAGAIPLSEASKLVRNRGLAMRQAAIDFGAPDYAMAAVMPLGEEEAREVCRLALGSSSDLQSNLRVCEIANINAPSQVVLSGTAPDIDTAGKLAKSEYKARLVKKLAVSAPFHSTVMQSAKPTLESFLDSIDGVFADPVVPVISNVTAEAVSDKDTLKRLAVEQLTATVQWVKSVKTATDEFAVDAFVELGGSVTTGLTQRCLEANESSRRECITEALMLNDAEAMREQFSRLNVLLK